MDQQSKGKGDKRRKRDKKNKQNKQKKQNKGCQVGYTQNGRENKRQIKKNKKIETATQQRSILGKTTERKEKKVKKVENVEKVENG